MKKGQIILTVLFTTLTMLCCKNTEEQEAEPTTETVDTLTTEKPNALSGIIYKEISDVPELKEYEKQSGAVIDPNKNSNGDFRYGIAQFSNDKNYVIVLEEFIKEANNPKPKYKILDTLNIAKLNIDEMISICTCRLNKTPDSEIIAIVKAQGSDDIEYYDHILKAWRADTKTQKILPIEDLKGIDCINESYGL